MLQQNHCMIVISKMSLTNQNNVVNLAKVIEKYPTETKLLALLDNDYLADEKLLLNITFNTLIFRMKTGGFYSLMMER